ncbi:MAG: hypothetical protein JKX73_10990 [Flavobacteriales bacterium]|nr:hypothetical protein [Flavobacteriales bacterium]
MNDFWADTSYCDNQKCTYWRSISKNTVVAHEDSVWIDSVLFLDVIVVQIRLIRSSGSWDGTMIDELNYYARDVGLIRMIDQGILYPGREFKIIDYSVNN